MKDFEKFQGTWQAVGLEENGRKRPLAEVKGTTVTVSGDRYTLRLRGRRFEGLITRIDPTKEPREVNFFGIEGLGSIDKRFLGIYLVEEDELTVCVVPFGRTRPTSFDPKPGSRYWLYLLNRVTPEPRVHDLDPGIRPAVALCCR